VVTELANEGTTDIVSSSISYTLGANLESLSLTGAGAINATGNELNNVLYGYANTAANVLSGGLGNDSYYAGLGDTVVEAAGAGTDTVLAYVDYTLGANQENLTGNVTTALRLGGNELNNIITGNAGADTIDGGAGNDALNGGAGNDMYLFSRGHGADTISENDATVGNNDIAFFDATVAKDQLWFRQVGNNLDVSIIGTADKFTMTNWYLGNQYHTEQFKTSDGKTLLDSQVQNLVSAMAAFAPPAAGQTTLSASYQASLAPVIAANWT
jgi:Ca2+-binding RTX toxin-like protein